MEGWLVSGSVFTGASRGLAEEMVKKNGNAENHAADLPCAKRQNVHVFIIYTVAKRNRKMTAI